jgi:NOL1/NOP2/fmu family ribosome biogenesis protein
MTTELEWPPDSIPIESIQWDFSWPEFAEEDERGQLLSFLKDRFGIPEALFRDYLIFKRKRNWWLLRAGPLIESAASLKVSRTGLRAFQRVGGFVKPTTRMIQVFGHAATKARLELSLSQLSRVLAGEEIPAALDLEPGYVILTLGKNQILGMGLLINGRVRSQIPKKHLRQDMLPFALSEQSGEGPRQGAPGG